MTPRELEVLKFLDKHPYEYIMIDGNLAYFGNERTSIPLVYSLLRAMAISRDPYSDARFQINETGRILISGK